MRVMYADERRMSLHKVRFNRFTNFCKARHAIDARTNSITFRKVGVKIC